MTRLRHLDQESLFDLGQPVPTEMRPITRGCALPVQINQTIDISRACSILDVKAKDTVLKLMKAGHIRGYRMRDEDPWAIEYASIVEYCDQLRLTYHIRDRRQKLAPGRRWRDEELLPFPRRDTMSVGDVMVALDINRMKALALCEEGRFECYRLLPHTGAAWRISKSSFFSFADSLREQLHRAAKPRV